jgi:hypothetical protein
MPKFAWQSRITSSLFDTSSMHNLIISKDRLPLQQVVLIVFLFTMGVWSCKGTTETPTVVTEPILSNLSLEFTHQFNGESIINKLPGLTHQVVLPSNKMLLEDVRFLVSKVALIHQDNTITELSGYGFANANGTQSDNIMQFSKVPAGTYKGIRFTIGLDSVINHGNPNQWATTHPLSPSRNRMHWGWLGGYIFMIMEGNYIYENKQRTFSYHIATLDFSKTITLNSPFTITSDSTVKTMKLAFNVDKMFNSSKGFVITPDNEFSHSTNDKTIVPVLVENMGNAFEFLSVTPAKQ